MPQLGPHEPQLGPHEPQLGPHEPQLLFPVVPAKVVVQTVKETKDKLEDVVSEQGLHTSQLMGEDVQNILALHHMDLKIRADVKNSPQYDNCAPVNIVSICF